MVQLIDNAKQAWRFVSIQLTALAALLTGVLVAFPTEIINAYVLLPAEVKQFLPLAEIMAMPWLKKAILALLVASIIARIIKQPKLHIAANPIKDPPR